jgi:drug/metabolite transporter (DMT)-like permease
LLYAYARARGAVAPTQREWRDAAISGGLLLTIGNGGVTWAELVIPSGVAALIVALVPLWIVLLDWFRPQGVRPRPLVFLGLAVGFAGVALLAPDKTNHASSAYGWAVVVLMASSMGWAIGSIFNRQAQKPASPLLGIAMQMFAGGSFLLVLAAWRGEFTVFSWSRITPVSAGAWFYLTTIGSLVGFTAYVWLLQVTTAAHVSTYAYVNPFIAMLLGCTIGHEPVSHKLFIAGALIVLAVALIVRSGSRPSPAAKNPGS